MPGLRRQRYVGSSHVITWSLCTNIRDVCAVRIHMYSVLATLLPHSLCQRLHWFYINTGLTFSRQSLFWSPGYLCLGRQAVTNGLVL
jgi:hypothetical protein